MKPHIRLRDIKCYLNYLATPVLRLKFKKNKRKRNLGQSWNISGPKQKAEIGST